MCDKSTNHSLVIMAILSVFVITFFSGCGGGGGGAAATPTPLPSTPAEKTAYFIGQLTTPATRLSGWLGLYDALGVPVLKNGAPIGSTGNDPIGIQDWQVWYASGLDQPGKGIPLSDVGRLIALTLNEVDGTAHAQSLLSDLRLATQSNDPQIKLLGLFVRERIMQGPSHVDILNAAVTPDTAIIDLPTIQLLGWIAMRGALLKSADATLPKRPLLPVAQVAQVTPKKLLLSDSGFNCSDLSSTPGTIASFLINKVGGGLPVPGMKEALPSLTQKYLTKLGEVLPQLNISEKFVAKANIAANTLNILTSAIGAGLQYLAMDYAALQEPDPLVRTKYSTYDGNSTSIALLVTYDVGKIPDGNSLKACYVGFVANAFGVSVSFPANGPIANTEIAIEPGKGFPDLVLFDLNNSSQTTTSRVTANANGQANINILGKKQKFDMPANATPVMKEFSILVSAQPEEAGLNTMANIFFDGMSFGLGGGLPAALSGVINTLKTFHWKEQELVFRIQDWATPGWNAKTTAKVDYHGQFIVDFTADVLFQLDTTASTETLLVYKVQSGTATATIADGPIAGSCHLTGDTQTFPITKGAGDLTIDTTSNTYTGLSAVNMPRAMNITISCSGGSSKGTLDPAMLPFMLFWANDKSYPMNSNSSFTNSHTDSDTYGVKYINNWTFTKQ